MKILYITLEDISLHKGSVIHIRQIIEGLRKRGHFVGLIARSLNESENFDQFYNLNKIPIKILKMLKLKNQPYIISFSFLFIYLLRVLSRYEIIYARDFHTVIIAFLPKIIFKKKLVFEINGLASEEQKIKYISIFNQFIASSIRIAERIATKFSDRIISVTPQIKKYLIQKYHCDEAKINIVSNGVDITKFFPIKNKFFINYFKRKYGIKENDILIVFTGNFARWQGVENLIDASLMLPPKIKFLIIGDGIMKEIYQKKIKQLGVSDKFIFTGMVNYSEISKLINLADICALPKIHLQSGYSPIKLYEYMACAKPIISSRVEGLEFIEKEGIGKLVTPGDAKSFVKAVEELVINKEKRIEMGQKALKLAIEKYDWKFKVEEIEKIIEKMIKNL